MKHSSSSLARRSKRNVVAYHNVTKSLSVNDWHVILTITVFQKLPKSLSSDAFSISNFTKFVFCPDEELIQLSQTPTLVGRETPLPLSPLRRRAFHMGPRRCGVSRAHQIVNSVLALCVCLQELEQLTRRQHSLRQQAAAPPTSRHTCVSTKQNDVA